MRDWLSDRARIFPDRTALVAAESGETWTFGELDDAVETTAGRLASLGVEAGDHLGMVLPPRPASVRVVHAAMRLGAVLVPMGPRLTATELSRQAEPADLTAVVCGEETEATVLEAVHDVPVASVDDPQEDATALGAAEPADVAPHDWDPEDLMLLLFTSGTTGDPKAVMLNFGNVLASAVSSVFRLGFDPGDRWLVALSLHHAGGITPVLRMPLYGTTAVVRRSFEAGPTADDIDSYDVTGASLVPTMLRRMLDARGTLSDTLRVVLLGGAPASRELVERCRNYSVPVHPTYGMTETASQIATARPREAFEEPGTVGRPLLWTHLSVRDESGERLSPGETGELVVSGATLSPGYYGDPEATREAYTEHGLRTGDVGRIDERGRVWVLNRKDDRIVTGGENVEPGEVVRVLRSHPDVADAAVVGVPDEEWGERVAALVVPSDADLTASDLVAHCRERLAGFKLPRTVEFAESLPRTASGTVERAAVRDRLVDGRPVSDLPPPERDDESGGGDAGSDEGDDGSDDPAASETGPDEESFDWQNLSGDG